MAISRRAVLGASAASLLGAPDDSALRVDGARLRADLEALGVSGRPAGGTFADGVSRVAYSSSDAAGRRFVMDAMAGIAVLPGRVLAGGTRLDAG